MSSGSAAFRYQQLDGDRVVLCAPESCCVQDPDDIMFLHRRAGQQVARRAAVPGPPIQ